eukprot:2143403-Pyramimonas_sp.AAC.1
MAARFEQSKFDRPRCPDPNSAKKIMHNAAPRLPFRNLALNDLHACIWDLGEARAYSPWAHH